MMVTSGNHSAVQISREIWTQVRAFHRCSLTPLKKIKITNTSSVLFYRLYLMQQDTQKPIPNHKI